MAVAKIGSVTQQRVPAAISVTAYVDGFNLYHGMHEARRRRALWLDLPGLLRSMLRPDQQLAAVHYFTALVTGPGRARQEQYLQAAEAHGAGLLVPHVGRFQRKTVTCRVCRQPFNTFEEKESDVSLAVQLVEDAAGGVFDQALIVSGDSDMAPAIHAVRRLRPDARLVALFPPRRSSHQLEVLADATLRIFDRTPERHQLPDPVVTSAMRIARPAYWR